MSNESRSAGSGTESVWDYPRPLRLESTAKQIRVEFGGIVIADSRSAFRVLETSHPPVYYIPQTHIAMQYLFRGTGASCCEWKGRAGYHCVVVGEVGVEKAAWSYANPTPAFRAIRDFIAFYPAPMDGCYVDRARHFAARRLLRRLDHLGSGRPVQGCSWYARLVGLSESSVESCRYRIFIALGDQSLQWRQDRA